MPSGDDPPCDIGDQRGQSIEPGHSGSMQPGDEKHRATGNEGDALEDAKRARLKTKPVLSVQRVTDQPGNNRASGQVGQSPFAQGSHHGAVSFWPPARLTSDSTLFRLEWRTSVP